MATVKDFILDENDGSAFFVYDDNTTKTVRLDQASAELPDPLIANIIPRQNTLDNLKSIVNGGGEIAVATDRNAIVVLKDSGPVEFSAIPADALTSTNTSNPALLNFKVATVRTNTITSTDAANSTLYISGQENYDLSGQGSNILISGGAGLNTTESYGGALNLSSGTGVTADGDISISIGGQTTLYAASEAPGGALVMGFFGGAASTKPTVTGSRGGNAALASLITGLAALGLITDNTTA